MKVEERKLYDVLLPALADVNDITRRSSTFGKKFISTLAEIYNLPIADATDILNGKIPVDSVSNDYLYKITRVLYKINMESEDKYNDVSKLDVKKYFNDIECEFYEQKNVSEEQIADLIFDEFIQMNDDMVFVKANNKLIAACRNVNRFRYNPDTQRRLIVKERRGLVYKQIPFNHVAGNEMMDAIYENKFITNTIYINSNPDLNEKLPYISRGKYIIPKECVIDIIDGFHRYIEIAEATYKAERENKILNYVTGIYVCTFSENKALQLIIQEDKKTHLSEEQRKEDDPNNDAAYIIKRLNEDSDFHLNGKLIGDMFLSLNNIIKYLFILKDRLKDTIPTYNLIKKGFNDIIETFGYEEYSIEKWFIYLYIIRYADKNNKNVCKIISSTDINSLLEKINIKKTPSVRHERIIDEVIKNENV